MMKKKLEDSKAIHEKSVEIGGIGNYYGGLRVVESNGGFFWAIENWNGNYWEEIPKSLYDELVKFNANAQS